MKKSNYSTAAEIIKARASREWVSAKDAKKRRKRESRLARMSRVEIAERIARVPAVRVLPQMPKWKPTRRQARAEEFDRLKGEVNRLEAQVDQLQRAQVRGVDFYDSPAWHRVRYTVLSRSGGCCELCGASKATGAIIQVDHIKPRSRFPELALTESNLQVLCRPCNMGKSNKDQIDWRKPELKVVRGS